MDMEKLSKISCLVIDLLESSIGLVDFGYLDKSSRLTVLEVLHGKGSDARRGLYDEVAKGIAFGLDWPEYRACRYNIPDDFFGTFMQVLTIEYKEEVERILKDVKSLLQAMETESFEYWYCDDNVFRAEELRKVFLEIKQIIEFYLSNSRLRSLSTSHKIIDSCLV